MHREDDESLTTLTTVRLLEDFKQAIQDRKLTVSSFNLENDTLLCSITLIVRAQRQ